MDPMTAVGIVLAIAATFIGMSMSGIDFMSVFFVDISSIVIVFGGSVGAAVASGTMSDAIGAGKVAVKALASPKPPDSASTIKQLLGFAETARKEGLLALESAAKEIQDPFLKKGIEMSVDGTDPEVVREVLETEISSVEARHKAGSGFWMKLAGYAPSFGVAGTVIGLIDMLNNLNDPAALGPALAIAFSTTLWGVFLANYLFTPIGLKLQRASELEVAYKELVLEGIIAIQAGSSPRAVGDRLGAYLTPAQQQSLQDKKSA